VLASQLIGASRTERRFASPDLLSIATDRPPSGGLFVLELSAPATSGFSTSRHLKRTGLAAALALFSVASSQTAIVIPVRYPGKADTGLTIDVRFRNLLHRQKDEILALSSEML
jgi:hypothetical protein